MATVLYRKIGTFSHLQELQASGSLFGYLESVSLSPIQALGTAAREARQKAGIKQVRIAAALNTDQSTIARFERGGQPRNLDAVLRAYADETGVPFLSISERGIELLAAGNGSNNNHRKS